MSKTTEEKYRVDSPIKRNGKRYNVGDSILLTKEVAEGLHVSPWGEKKEAGKDSSAPAPSPSSGLSAENAISMIESVELKNLKGFVIPKPEGTEDRKTVLEAWAAKQESGDKKEKK